MAGNPFLDAGKIREQKREALKPVQDNVELQQEEVVNAPKIDEDAIKEKIIPEVVEEVKEEIIKPEPFVSEIKTETKGVILPPKKNKKSVKKSFNFSLSKDLVEQIDEAAEAIGYSRSELATYLFNCYLDSLK